MQHNFKLYNILKEKNYYQLRSFINCHWFLIYILNFHVAHYDLRWTVSVFIINNYLPPFQTFYFFVGFYVAPTLKGYKATFQVYIISGTNGTWVEPQTFCKLAGSRLPGTWNNPTSIVGFKPTAVRGEWCRSQLPTDAPSISNINKKNVRTCNLLPH